MTGCCEVEKKKHDKSHPKISYRWSYVPGLSTTAASLIAAGASLYSYYITSSTVLRRRSTSNTYVEGFVFAGRIE